MKLWVDNVRPAPEGYIWCFSVEAAEAWIKHNEECVARFGNPGIELIDIDHDLCDYAKDGGNDAKLLNWLEETGRNYHIRIHNT